MGFEAQKQEPSNFNDNIEYKDGDGIQAETWNALVNALLYAQSDNI